MFPLSHWKNVVMSHIGSLRLLFPFLILRVVPYKTILAGYFYLLRFKLTSRVTFPQSFSLPTVGYCRYSEIFINVPVISNFICIALLISNVTEILTDAHRSAPITNLNPPREYKENLPPKLSAGTQRTFQSSPP